MKRFVKSRQGSEKAVAPMVDQEQDSLAVFLVSYNNKSEAPNTYPWHPGGSYHCHSEPLLVDTAIGP